MRDKSPCKMSQIEVKAQQLRLEAQKKMNSSSFLKSLFMKSSSHLEESIEYFSRAGNLFKMVKNWLQAGNAFADAAELNLKNENLVEAAINYIEAANCFKKCDTEKAIDYYLKSITIYQEVGKFVMAAKYHQVIAELLEDEYDIEEAVVHYEKAADFYKQECSLSSANKCFEKIAEYVALAGDYDRAINIFQEIACFDLASSLLKYCAKEYFFRAAICLLCAEVDIRPKLLTYVNMYPALEDSREYQLILCLLECIEVGDKEGFTNAIRKFDSVSQLKQWHITMLLRIKNQMTNAPDLR